MTLQNAKDFLRLKVKEFIDAYDGSNDDDRRELDKVSEIPEACILILSRVDELERENGLLKVENTVLRRAAGVELPTGNTSEATH